MKEWHNRVMTERVELADKIYDLDTFISADYFDDLVDPVQSTLMREQLRLMRKYENILTQRITGFEL